MRTGALVRSGRVRGLPSYSRSFVGKPRLVSGAITLGMVVMMAVMLSGMVWGVAAAVRSRRGGHGDGTPEQATRTSGAITSAVLAEARRE